MEVKAKQVSAEFLNMPKEDIFLVHSCFEHGFNLAAEGRLCFIGNKHDEQLPYGILLKKEEIQKIRGTIFPGETSFYMDQAAHRLVSGRLVIDFRDAQVFSSRYNREGRIKCQRDLPEIFGFIKDERTGFGGTIEEVMAGKCRDTKGLMNCFQSRNEKEVNQILKKWVGCGPGLTPSGDDFLLGILFADQMSPFLRDTFKEELVKLADPAYTTFVSINQYFCAFQKLYCGSFLGFAEGWKTDSRSLMAENIRRLLAFGHTSGRDMAAGLWTGMRYAADAAHIRCSA